MDTHTAIDAGNFVVADLKDEDVGGIVFEGNKKIEYLPYKIYMQFPNLYAYFAKGAAIKYLTKENFEKLNRLLIIDLAFNNIQKIRADTFSGVPYLENIFLSEFIRFF